MYSSYFVFMYSLEESLNEKYYILQQKEIIVVCMEAPVYTCW